MFDGLGGGFRSRPIMYGDIISDCKTNGASQVSFRRRSILEKIQLYRIWKKTFLSKTR